MFPNVVAGSIDLKLRDDELITIWISVSHIACCAVKQHIATHRRIFVSAYSIIIGGWSRIGNSPCEGLFDSAGAIIRRDRHTMRTVHTALAGGWINGAADNARIRINRQTLRQPRGAVGKRIAINILEEIAHIKRRDGISVLVRLIVNRTNSLWSVIDWINRDGEIGGIRATFPIADRIGDRRNRAVPVFVRRKRVSAGAVERKCANAQDRSLFPNVVAGSIDLKLRDDELITIWISVSHIACCAVKQHIATHRRIFVSAYSIIIGGWSRIGNSPCEGLFDSAGAIIRRDRHTMRTVHTALAGGWINGAADNARIRINRQTLRQARCSIGKRIAINILEVPAHIKRRDGISVIVRLIVNRTNGLRHVINGRNFYIKSACRRTAVVAVTDSVGNGRNLPVPVGNWFKGI